MVETEYFSYKNALNILKMKSLKNRRETFFWNFSNNSLKVQQMKTNFKDNTNAHIMETKKKEKNKITKATHIDKPGHEISFSTVIF